MTKTSCRGNLDKSYKKHGIVPSEAEEVFLDKNLKVIKDIKHSQKEKRFIAIGKTSPGGKKILMDIPYQSLIKQLLFKGLVSKTYSGIIP